MSNARIEYFLRLIRRDNAEEIESARDEIIPEDIGPLAKVYWTLETWSEKAGLIQIVQDTIDPRTRGIMLDFLKAPPDTSGDYVEITKAIALCHLDRDFAAFDRYYRDRQLLAATVERYLREERP